MKWGERFCKEQNKFTFDVDMEKKDRQEMVDRDELTSQGKTRRGTINCYTNQNARTKKQNNFYLLCTIGIFLVSLEFFLKVS